MGLRSFFWRFLPFMLSLLGVEEGAAAPATFLAFSMAAFLMPSEPFMMQRLGVWRGYCKRRLTGFPGSERWYSADYRTEGVSGRIHVQCSQVGGFGGMTSSPMADGRLLGISQSIRRACAVETAVSTRGDAGRDREWEWEWECCRRCCSMRGWRSEATMGLLVECRPLW